MSVIQINQLSFHYEGALAPVFEDLSLRFDSAWRLGLVGRNGRGKTTLLRLLKGELQGTGQIISAVDFDLFPFPVDLSRDAESALIDSLVPFTRWEADMADCLAAGTPEALTRYGELQARYSARDGYAIRGLLAREAALMGFEQESLSRPLSSFSPGERVRLTMAALFVRQNHFLLIDEPTNHLDMAGREKMAAYLAGKSGFLVASHDRSFLCTACDHILALEKQGARLVNGNYTTYRKNKQRQDDYERAENERIQKDIRRLRASAREKAGWSDKIEASKIGHGVGDRGYVGAQSARMMKRALAIHGRIEKQAQQQESLLKNLEYTAKITLPLLRHKSPVLLRLEKAGFAYGKRALFERLDLVIKPGDRLALTGPNGAGKSTLLGILSGGLAPTTGSVWRPQGLIISHLPQTSHHLSGTPREIALARGLDLTRFLMLLRKFDLPQEHFEQNSAGFSLGQKKKLLLALSLCEPAHLYLWDEPLNDIDPESREQIEDMLIEADAALVFIEHERAFVKRVATAVLALG
ncbi:MAG: ribosomal protection-like ABC-F family protein [Christensenellales bacterium]|jgi:lincosamide and streptogramin A transport system ATP-binding/permease protein